MVRQDPNRYHTFRLDHGLPGTTSAKPSTFSSLAYQCAPFQLSIPKDGTVICSLSRSPTTTLVEFTNAELQAAVQDQLANHKSILRIPSHPPTTTRSTPVQLVDKMPVQIQLLLVLHSLKVECWRIKAKKTSTDPAVIFEEISIGSRRCLDQTVVVEDGEDVDNVHTAASIPSHHPHDHRFESTPSQNNNRNNADAHLTNNWHSHLIIDSGLFSSSEKHSPL
ncbi:hypothetical protein PSHT_00735 [Puccinia striiformis]|uniref:Uncharacterized protein n=1 Tax=Puccinia striiformis TaxID=27350 RepID=A0A2S4WMK3_9BASI|nr:hypothetical protein PSHT_00735 [Puccinia striiformis]